MPVMAIEVRWDSSAERAKVEREGRCRLHESGFCIGPLSAAHVIGRSWALEPLTRQVLTDDAPIPEVRGDPALIVPLCRLHNTVHQLRKLDLLDYLTAEEAQAVLDAGSLASARRRLRPP